MAVKAAGSTSISSASSSRVSAWYTPVPLLAMASSTLGSMPMKQGISLSSVEEISHVKAPLGMEAAETTCCTWFTGNSASFM